MRHASTYHTATDSKIRHTLNYSVGEQHHKAHPVLQAQRAVRWDDALSLCRALFMVSLGPPPSPARLLPGAVLPVLKKAEAAPTPRKRITNIQVSSTYINHYFLHV